MKSFVISFLGLSLLGTSLGCGRENNNDDPLLVETRRVDELSANELGTTCREISNRIRVVADRQTIQNISCKLAGLQGDTEEECEQRIARCEMDTPPTIGFDCSDTRFANRCGDQIVADIVTCQGAVLRTIADLEADLEELTCSSAGMDLDDAFEEEFDNVENAPGCTSDLVRCSGV